MTDRSIPPVREQNSLLGSTRPGRYALVVALLFLTACQPAVRETPFEKAMSKFEPVGQGADVNDSSGQTAEAAATEEAAADYEVALGTDQTVRAGQPVQVSSPDEGARDVVLNFQGADVQEVVKVVIGDVLGRNYVVDPAVSGKITTETSSGLRKEDLLPVLERLLRLNGATLIDRGDLIEVLPSSGAVKATSPHAALREGTAPAGFSTRIYPLRFVGVAEMQKILAPLAGEEAVVYADTVRNLLILAGTAAEQRRYADTIATFDVNWMEGMSVGLYRIEHAAPSDVMKELGEALGDEQGKFMNGLVRLVEIERISALLAISPSSDALSEIGRWIRRLDIPGDSLDPNLYVIRLQNAKAAEVAGILSEVFAKDGKSATRRPVELAPGNRAETVASRAEKTADKAERSKSAAASSTRSGAGVAVSVGEDVRIIPDETNNALVVMATPREYEIILAAVRKLDIVPLQVLVEASIIEVSLEKKLQYGVEWYFKNGFGDSKSGIGILDLGDAGVNRLAPGFSYAVLDGVDDVRVVLNALDSESELKILSSPSLMVLDNQTATINVGDEIPVPTSEATSNIDSNARTVNQIQYRNTGVTLEVTPRVNAGGLVTMEVNQEVSEAAETKSSELNAPTIVRRSITSTVAVQSGQTIVLGGLIREAASGGESGVPVMRSIPVLGKLFGQTTDTKVRTELLVLITPRAVGGDSEARALSREYAEKMRGIW